jgi:hypothetical protein
VQEAAEERTEAVDALATAHPHLFIFSGEIVTMRDKDGGETTMPLSEMGVVGPVDAASTAPSLRFDQPPSVLINAGSVLYLVDPHGERTVTTTLENLAERYDLPDLDPAKALEGVGCYSLRQVLWPWGFHRLEMQWGYRDWWAGDDPPPNDDMAEWDGSLGCEGPALQLPSLRKLHEIDAGGETVRGALYSWTHTNLMESQAVFQGSRETGEDDRYDAHDRPRAGSYHYFATGFSWRSTTTDDWDGVDTGFFYSLADATTTTVRIRFDQQSFDRTWTVEELTTYHEVIDLPPHKLEIGEVDSLPTDVADLFVECGRMPEEHHGHGGEYEIPIIVVGEPTVVEAGREGSTRRSPARRASRRSGADATPGISPFSWAVWDGYFEVLPGGWGYLQLSDRALLEERGGSVTRGDDDWVFPPLRGGEMRWRASTVNPGPNRRSGATDQAIPAASGVGAGHPGVDVLDQIAVEVAIPNPRYYPNRTRVRGQAGRALFLTPPLDPPAELCGHADLADGLSVHVMVHWCWFNAE